MMENEAIENLREKYMDVEYYFAEHDCYMGDYDTEFQESINVAIKALSEIQQYRAIGTVEECRAAVERQNGIRKNPVGELMKFHNRTYPRKSTEIKVFKGEPDLPKLESGDTP